MAYRIVLFVGCWMALAAQGAHTSVTIGNLLVVYRGRGVLSTNVIQGTNAVHATVTISSAARGESVQMRVTPRGALLGMPYHVTLISPSNQLTAVTVNFGKGPTNTLYTNTLNAIVNDLGTLQVKHADLSVTSTTVRSIGRVQAQPGVSCLYAPHARIGSIIAHAYVGDVNTFNAPVTNILPAFRIWAERINLIRTKREAPQWVGHVFADRIGKIRTTSLSHIAASTWIGLLRCTNLTGFVQVGIILTNGQFYGIMPHGVIQRIRTGIIYDSCILASVPYLAQTAGTGTYYDTVASLGSIKSVRARSTLNSVLVSKRHIGFGGRRKRPRYGNGTEIWENMKLRKIKIYPQAAALVAADDEEELEP